MALCTVSTALAGVSVRASLSSGIVGETRRWRYQLQMVRCIQIPDYYRTASAGDCRETSARAATAAAMAAAVLLSCPPAMAESQIRCPGGVQQLAHGCNVDSRRSAADLGSIANLQEAADLEAPPLAQIQSNVIAVRGLTLADLDPGSAKIISTILGPLFAGFNFLFIIRIVMSWYPQLPVDKLPFVIPYVPTEPILGPTRRLIPPVGGVDVAPVIWVALMSFLNEILLGPQGLLVLLSQQRP